MGNKKKPGRKSSSLAYRIREHGKDLWTRFEMEIKHVFCFGRVMYGLVLGLIVVKLGQKLSETVKGKLSLGARVVREGGRENIFRQVFGMSQGEQMLKASQCYLSTTAGPIAGLLFVSTEKIAFCSERSITISSPDGHFITTPYKVPNSKYLTCSNINLFLFFKIKL